LFGFFILKTCFRRRAAHERNRHPQSAGRVGGEHHEFAGARLPEIGRHRHHIASPVAYFFMQKWLADFAYRIDIQWWMFAVAGLAAVGMAFLTVSFQSVKAALANPVKSLRSE
jgi:hypothetical protein